jgi:ATP-binding cassette subfamily D (ALD) protein 3
MLVMLAQAIGRIALAGREMTKLAGFTERVDQLIKVLDDLNQGIYQRTMVDSNNNGVNKPHQTQSKPNSGKIIYQDNIIK